MGSNVKPPDNPADLAKLIGGQPPASPAKPVGKKPKASDEQPELRHGRHGDKCPHKRPDGSDCPGKLTDMGGYFHDRENKVTRTTLICRKCNKVAAQLVVPDPS